MRELLQKYRAFKEDFVKRSPRGKWSFVHQIGIHILEMCGVAVIDKKFKITWYSFACGVVVLDVIVSFIYTFWYYSGGIEAFLVIPEIGIVFSVSSTNQIYRFIFLLNERSSLEYDGFNNFPNRLWLCIFRR